MKITKKQLKQIIKEELSHSRIGAGRSPKEVFTSAHESLMQAHKDMQMLQILMKNGGVDPQPTESLIKSIEQELLSLNDLIKQDVEDLQAASEILNTRMGSYKGTTLPGGKNQMKITKKQLKKIIKEELSLQEMFGRDIDMGEDFPSDRGMGQKVSRMINALEQIGSEVEKAHQSTRDPATIQHMEMIDGLITKLHDEMSDLL